MDQTKENADSTHSGVTMAAIRQKQINLQQIGQSAKQKRHLKRNFSESMFGKKKLSQTQSGSSNVFKQSLPVVLSPTPVSVFSPKMSGSASEKLINDMLQSSKRKKSMVTTGSSMKISNVGGASQSQNKSGLFPKIVTSKGTFNIHEYMKTKQKLPSAKRIIKQEASRGDSTDSIVEGNPQVRVNKKSDQIVDQIIHKYSKKQSHDQIKPIISQNIEPIQLHCQLDESKLDDSMEDMVQTMNNFESLSAQKKINYKSEQGFYSPLSNEALRAKLTLSPPTLNTSKEEMNNSHLPLQLKEHLIKRHDPNQSFYKQYNPDSVFRRSKQQSFHNLYNQREQLTTTDVEKQKLDAMTTRQPHLSHNISYIHEANPMIRVKQDQLQERVVNMLNSSAEKEKDKSIDLPDQLNDLNHSLTDSPKGQMSRTFLKKKDVMLGRESNTYFDSLLQKRSYYKERQQPKNKIPDKKQAVPKAAKGTRKKLINVSGCQIEVSDDETQIANNEEAFDPNVMNLGVPSKRQDAIILMRWMDNMLVQLKEQEDQFSEYDAVEMVQLIYSVTWKELIRQVSVQCVERGYVMQKIFDAYIHILTRQVQLTEKKKKSYEVKLQKNLLQIKSKHDTIIENMETKIVSLLEQKEKVDTDLRIEKEMKHDLEGYVSKLKKKIASMQGDLDQVREEKKAQNRDITFLKTKIIELTDKVKYLEGEDYVEEEDDVLESEQIEQAKQAMKEAMKEAVKGNKEDGNEAATEEFAEVDRGIGTHEYQQWLKDEYGDGKIAVEEKGVQYDIIACDERYKKWVSKEEDSDVTDTEDEQPKENQIISSTTLADDIKEEDQNQPTIITISKEQLQQINQDAKQEDSNDLITIPPQTSRTLGSPRPTQTNATLGLDWKIVYQRGTGTQCDLVLVKDDGIIMAGVDSNWRDTKYVQTYESMNQIYTRQSLKDMPNFSKLSSKSLKSQVQFAEDGTSTKEEGIQSQGEQLNFSTILSQEQTSRKQSVIMEAEDEENDLEEEIKERQVDDLKKQFSQLGISLPQHQLEKLILSEDDKSQNTEGILSQEDDDDIEEEDYDNAEDHELTQEQQIKKQKSRLSKVMKGLQSQKQKLDPDQCKAQVENILESLGIPADQTQGQGLKLIMQNLMYQKSKLAYKNHKNQLRIQRLENKTQEMEVNNYLLQDKLDELDEMNSKLEPGMDEEDQENISTLSLVGFKQGEGVNVSNDAASAVNESKSQQEEPKQKEKAVKKKKNPFAALQKRRTKQQSMIFNIIEGIRKKPVKKLKDPMPKKLALKLISQLYSERFHIGFQNQNTPPLFEFVYDYLSNKYGLKKVAEKKFVQLLTTLLMYQNNNRRMKVFASFVGLNSEEQYSQNDLRQYHRIEQYLINSRVGIMHSQGDSEDQILIPFIRAQEYWRVYYEGKLSDQQTKHYKKIVSFYFIILKLDSMKHQDPKKVNKSGMIEQDRFIQFLIQLYREQLAERSKNLQDLYLAADIHNSSFVTLEEFQVIAHLVCKIEGERAMKIFYDFASRNINPDDDSYQPLLNFKLFSRLAFERNVFTEKQQLAFLGTLDVDKLENMALQLKENVEDVIEHWISTLVRMMGKTPQWDTILNEFKNRSQNIGPQNIISEESPEQDIYSYRAIVLQFKVIETKIQEQYMKVNMEEFWIPSLDIYITEKYNAPAESPKHKKVASNQDLNDSGDKSGGTSPRDIVNKIKGHFRFSTKSTASNKIQLGKSLSGIQNQTSKSNNNK